MGRAARRALAPCCLALVGCELLVPIGDRELAPPASADGGPGGGDGGEGAGGGDGGTLAGQATVLAREQNGPRGLAVSTSHVYWVNGEAGEVARVAKEGGAVQVLATGQTSPLDVAVDGRRVFWFNQGGRRSSLLRSMPLEGGDIVSMGDIDGTAFRRMTADATTLWVSKESEVVRVPKTGSFTTAAFPAPPSAMASDGSTLYVATGSNVMAAPGGAAPMVFATGTSQVADVAVDESSVYWVTAGGELVKRAKTEGGSGPGTVITTGLDAAVRLTLFAEHVYVTAAGAGTATGRLVGVSKAGGAPEVLARDLAEAFGLAVDGSGVYWSQYGDGTVKRLAFSP